MFRSTVRNTTKTLLRSRTVWLVLIVFAFIMIRRGVQPHVLYMPGYEPLHISFRDFAMELSVAVYTGLDYPLPIFTVVATVLVLNRDCGDSFFEVEKAAGVKPSRYLLGRMCAVAAVSFAAQWILSFVELQLAVYNRSSLEGYTLPRYLGLSVYRLTYVNLCTALPTILFYIGFVYLIGMLFRNGIAATVGGFAYTMISYYGWSHFRREIDAEIYVGYINPLAEKLRNYFMYQGLEDEQKWLAVGDTSLLKALIAIGILVIACVCCSLLSYLLVRKREV